MTRREFLEAVGLALTGALAGFLTGRALVVEEVGGAQGRPIRPQPPI